MDLRPDATRCYLVSDLHGDPAKYRAFIDLLAHDPPDVVFLAGDLLPPARSFSDALHVTGEDFVNRYLVPRLLALRDALGPAYPVILLILGNDDARFEEPSVLSGAVDHAWHYISERRVTVAGRSVFGYSCIPPSPFRLKDWERYDVSRFVDPGSVSPEEGVQSVPRSARERRNATIANDLDRLIRGESDITRAVFLLHAPPYDTPLDAADLSRVRVDGVPLDPHIGSIAVRRMIEAHRPHLTLHGHAHETFRLTGEFAVRIGPTWCLSAVHDGPELVVVEFPLAEPGEARRRVIGTGAARQDR